MKRKSDKLNKILCCPNCLGAITPKNDTYYCKKCRKTYPNVQEIPNFLLNIDKNKKKQKDIWDKKTYKVDPETHLFTTIQERFGNNILQNLDLPKNALVVDIGCFIGEKLWQLKNKKNYIGVGVDIAIDSLIAAKQINPYGQYFLAADLENLPFKDNSVDCVLIFDVIEHLTNQEKGFSEVSRILKPGGTFLLHIPIKDNRFSMFWFKQKLFPKQAMKDYLDVGHSPERMLTSTQIKNYLKANHLQVKWEIYYNSFLVHFFDRELMGIIGKAISTISKNKKIGKSQSRFVHTGNFGKTRSLYAQRILPIFEKVSALDKPLSKMKIGNTFFVYSVREE